MISPLKSITYQKICKRCNIEKPLSDFHKHPQMSDGHVNFCKKCKNNESKKYRQLNKDKCRDLRQAWAEKNREKDREYKKAYKVRHREKHLKQKSEYAKNNRAKYNAWTNRYRAMKKCATMPLTEFEELWLNEIYDLAQIKTEQTGIQYDVDHIVPLVSDVVCGLHHPSNLRVIPHFVNKSKSNTFRI